MSASRKPRPAPRVSLENVSVTIPPYSAPLEAISALARAAERNAEAIVALARSIEPPAGPTYGIFVEGDHNDGTV